MSFLVEVVMHRDKKVGLALAILLIGIVAAFFRPAPERGQKPPELDDLAAVNDRIAERENVPYLTGVEADPFEDVLDGVEASSSPPVPPTYDGQFSDSSSLPSADAESTDFLAGSSFTPDPIRPRAEQFHPRRDATPTSRLNGDWEPFPARRGVRTAEPAVSGRIHVVKSGETLTGISEHYFGTQSRFLDIFKLNQSRMSSPNALRAGMKIRIPAGKSATSPTSPSDAFAPHRSASGADVFSPFVRRKSSASATTPKSLSQVPPIDLPSIDGETPRREASAADDALPVRTISPSTRTYRVRRGDSLERLGVKFYGNRSAARKIFAANRDRLKSPDAIREGMSLVLP